MTNETPQFFFNRKGKRLFGILHAAGEGEGRRGLGVVYCAPLFEEKLWSHRVAVNFARFLASQGIDVLRFDYFGDGESEGLFEDASVMSRGDDILDAVDFCREKTDVAAVYVLGLGYGATLALCAGLPAAAVAGIVAWAPIMDGRRYLNDVLRGHIATQMVVHRKIAQDREALVAQIESGQSVNVEGYEIARPLYAQMAGVDLLALLRGARKPVLIVQVAPAEATDRQYVELQNIGNPAVEFHKVRENKFWMEQKSIFAPCRELFALTTDWLLKSATS